MDWIVVGFVAGALTSTSFLPQIVKGWRTKRLTDVSPLMLGAMDAGLLLWLAYGLAVGDLAIIAANVVGLILTTTLLLLWLRFGRPPVPAAS